jgi:hypothetical protein
MRQMRVCTSVESENECSFFFLHRVTRREFGSRAALLLVWGRVVLVGLEV